MSRRSVSLAALAAVAVSCGGGDGTTRKTDERKVTGNYALTYDDKVTLRLSVGGATREVTHSGFGGVVDFGSVNGQPVTLDLGQFCAREEVKCPSEAFWQNVAIDQPDLMNSYAQLQRLVVVNDTVHTLPAGQQAQTVSGLVNHDDEDRFLLGLGVNGGANQACLALALSLAGGRFTRVGEHFETVQEYRTPAGAKCTPADGGVGDGGTSDAGTAATDAGASAGDAGVHDAGVPVPCMLTDVKKLVVPPGAAADGIAEGKVFLGFAGGCAFGPALVGAALTMQTGFTGKRTGDFNPPPFTPAPVTLPDGGLPDSALDGGVDGGASGTDGGQASLDGGADAG